MPRRPCLEPGCPALAQPGQARCHPHTRQHDRRRGTRQQRGYDATYEQARATVLAGSPPCHWCGAPATTADHDPPMAQAGTHYRLVPACARCNFGHRSTRQRT